MLTQNKSKICTAFVLVAPYLIVIAGIVLRLTLINQVGKDTETFVDAVEALISGKNPYHLTIRSFEDSDIYSSGYAYFPGLLYTYTLLYAISSVIPVSFAVLWKIPTLLAEVGVALLLLKVLKDRHPIIKILVVLVWVFNPYLVSELRYTYNDPVSIVFLLLAVYYLNKDDVLSGAFYGLSVAFKTFPIFVFPVFLLLSRDRVRFLISGLIVGFTFSLPFLRSISDVSEYIRGSLLVHEGRGIMGRPLLYFISYYLRLEFLQLIPAQTYTYLASFTGWIFAGYLYYIKKLRDPYLLITIIFTLFYVFTPVFNRTYPLWFLPFFIVSVATYVNQKWLTTSILSLFYAIYYWYLYIWIDGFHIRKPF